jgi:hypothetical protein
MKTFYLILFFRAILCSIIRYNNTKNIVIPVDKINTAFSRSNREEDLVVYNQEGKIYSCDLIQDTNFTCKMIEETKDEILLLNDNENTLLTIMNKNNGNLTVRNTFTGNMVYSTKFDLEGINSGILLNDDNQRILLANKNNLTIIHQNFTIIKPLQDAEKYFNQPVILSNGMLLTVSGYPIKVNETTPPDEISLWDPNNNYNLVKTLPWPTYNKCLLELSNGMLVTTVSQNAQVFIRDPKQDYNVVKNLTRDSWESCPFQLSNGLLITGGKESNNDTWRPKQRDIINFWDPNNDFKLVKTLTNHAGILLELSNGLVLSKSMREYCQWLPCDYDYKILDPKDDYKIVKTFENLDKFLNLPNGMFLMTNKDNYNIEILNPNENFTLVKTLSDHKDSITFLLLLSNGMLLSLDRDDTANYWNIKEDYKLVNRVNNVREPVCELSNGMIISSGNRNKIDIYSPHDDYNFALSFKVGNFTERDGPYDDNRHAIKELLSLSNGMLLARSDEDDWLFLNTNRLMTTTRTNHTKEIKSLKKINDTRIISMSEDMICVDNFNNHTKNNNPSLSSKCTSLAFTVTDLIMINSTHFISSDNKGGISYWDFEELKVIKSLHLSEIVNTKDFSLPDSTYITKLFFYDGQSHMTGVDILAYLNTNMILVLSGFDLQILFLEDTMCSNLVHLSDSSYLPFSTERFSIICSTGERKYYQYAPTLYLNKQELEGEIDLREALYSGDYYEKSDMSLNAKPECLHLFNGNRELDSYSIIKFDDKLNYKLNLPCAEDSEGNKIEFATTGYKMKLFYEVPMMFQSRRSSIKVSWYQHWYSIFALVLILGGILVTILFKFNIETKRVEMRKSLGLSGCVDWIRKKFSNGSNSEIENNSLNSVLCEKSKSNI